MQILFASLLLSLFVGALSCDADPDHTNEGLSLTNCGTGIPVIVHSLAVNNDNGSPDYPVNVDAPVNIVLNFTNSANHAWNDIIVKAEIARYTNIFGFCSWIGVPTFGLLDHLDACHLGDTSLCPLQPGQTIFKDRVDFSQFQTILNILSVSEPYRLSLTYTSQGTEISCVVIEGKIRKN